MVKFTDDQRQAMSQAFQENAYPSSDESRCLAEKIGLKSEQVKNWFQHARYLKSIQAKENSKQLEPICTEVEAKRRYPIRERVEKANQLSMEYDWHPNSKLVRNKLTLEQRSVLQNAVDTYGLYPKGSVFKELSTRLGLTLAQVHSWYGNERFKMRLKGHTFSAKETALLMGHLKHDPRPSPKTLKQLSSKLRLSMKLVKEWFEKHRTTSSKRANSVGESSSLSSENSQSVADSSLEIDDLLNDDNALDSFLADNYNSTSNSSPSSARQIEVEIEPKFPSQSSVIVTQDSPNNPPTKVDEIELLLFRIGSEFKKKLCKQHDAIQLMMSEVKQEIVELRGKLNDSTLWMPPPSNYANHPRKPCNTLALRSSLVQSGPYHMTNYSHQAPYYNSPHEQYNSRPSSSPSYESTFSSTQPHYSGQYYRHQ